MVLEADVVVQVLLRERLRITALAAGVLRDTHGADDIFQQVVLAALEHRSEFRDSGHLLAWSLRAARHRAVDACRLRQTRVLPDEVLDLLESPDTDVTDGSWSDRVEALHRCLAELTPSARGLLQLRYGEGLSAVDVARRLSRTADAVYQSLSRLHRGLRECVEKRLVGGAVRGTQ
ncbi:sigma-70 family RNA polymerase sigma factor [Gemmata sp. JC717]|uniref:sigma-70 family RNA polymerase sigma factor n=1 Tax=Gemmata algarum TaxID=2975278 RepID=UPI0021BAB0B6|nr:sigma-70 family RNA polymerase sigma factor [Gemmata algarum]MDY3555731.1 sigma-70 family RNA polymerase sigma factor [Gemmata algarum]